MGWIQTIVTFFFFWFLIKRFLECITFGNHWFFNSFCVWKEILLTMIIYHSGPVLYAPCDRNTFFFLVSLSWHTVKNESSYDPHRKHAICRQGYVRTFSFIMQTFFILFHFVDVFFYYYFFFFSCFYSSIFLSKWEDNKVLDWSSKIYYYSSCNIHNNHNEYFVHI